MILIVNARARTKKKAIGDAILLYDVCLNEQNRDNLKKLCSNPRNHDLNVISISLNRSLSLGISLISFILRASFTC